MTACVEMFLLTGDGLPAVCLHQVPLKPTENRNKREPYPETAFRSKEGRQSQIRDKT